MLTQAHIDHIKGNRAQITHGRTESVALRKRTKTGEDPFTGDATYEVNDEIVEATWKTLISESGGEGEVQYVAGVQVETDDVIINIDISVDLTGLESVKRISDGEEYAIKATDRIGLGEANRHFILLELIK